MTMCSDRVYRDALRDLASSAVEHEVLDDQNGQRVCSQCESYVDGFGHEEFCWVGDAERWLARICSEDGDE